MIVLDASTAILLAKAELLDQFVESLKEPVVMPREVERECCGRRELLDAQMIASMVKAERIEVRPVRDRKLCEQLGRDFTSRSEEHTSELQSLAYLVCRLLLEKKKNR